MVALSVNTGLVLALQAHPDGHANEVRFVPAMLPPVRGRVTGARLWLADRAFSYPEQLEYFSTERDAFVIRLRGDISFQRDPSRPARELRDAEGRPIRQEWGWLGRATGKHRYYVRRLTLTRPGEEALVLVTNLLDERRYPAEDLCELYRCRWTIERAFQQVTEVFSLKHLIGGSPEASVFQFAFCLLLYNVLQVVRAYIAEAERREPETISTEKLFGDVREHLVGWALLIGPAPTRAAFATETVTSDQVRTRMRTLLASVWRRRWTKAPPKKRSAAFRRSKRQTHVSAYRILKAGSPHAKMASRRKQ